MRAPRGAPAGSGVVLMLAMALTILAGLPLRAETLVTTLSTREVAITSTYSGAEIVVFGVIEQDRQGAPRGTPYDVVITARGPRHTAIVREKERIGPVWINQSQRHFIELPIFLAVLSTRPVRLLAPPEVLMQHRLGLDAMTTPDGIEITFDAPEVRFREALQRLNGRNGLFVEQERGIRFITSNVFRGTIPLPATTPTGRYEVETVLISGGERIASQTIHFRVNKRGFEQAVVVAAREYPLTYGIAAAVISLLFGWLATIVFRRD